MKIRKAREEDAEYFIEIKNKLSFKNVNGSTTKGGFLLGTNIEQYKEYIVNEIVLVAEVNERVVGFGIILNNDSVKKSEIWQKRNAVQWAINIEEYTETPICYFEQLAFIPGYSRLVIQLCFQIVQIAFEKHKTLFTTTVHAPILNLAAVPYILRTGGTKIGVIQEHYPEIGALISDVYLISKTNFDTHILQSNRYDFLHKQ